MRDLRLKPIPEAELKELAVEWANNEEKFASYISWKRFADAEKFACYEPMHRDSGALSRSNTQVIRDELKKFAHADDERIWDEPRFGKDFVLKGDFLEGQASCSLVGWRTQFHVRVYDSEGKITPAFTRLMQMLDAENDYPVLDEDHYSEIEQQDAIISINGAGSGHLKDDAPEGWRYEVLHALTKDGHIGDHEVANSIGDEEVLDAMRTLGYFQEETA